MMEVEIYMKGYFLVDGVPKYYPSFWGLVTEVTDNYSGGSYTISISCSDILHWWETQFINVNPAFMHWGAYPNAEWQMFGHKFAGDNPYDIIFSLSRTVFGDVMQAVRSLTGLTTDSSPEARDASLNIMKYWQGRFIRLTRALVMYGLGGNKVLGTDIFTKYKFQKGGSQGVVITDSADKAIAGAEWTGGPASSIIRLTAPKDTPDEYRIFTPESTSVAAFQTDFTNAGNVEFFQSTYMSKLEVAQVATASIGFEFYMDVDGSLVFKPPFYNVDVRPNYPVSWIRDIDIVDWNFSESDSDVVTHLTMKGSWGGKINYGMSDVVQPVTSITDYRLLRKYGWRSQDFDSEYFSDARALFLYGFNVMDQINSDIHSGSITIPIRPELRLGFPIYLEPHDCFWYVRGLSHTYTRGSSCTTTLDLSARRQKFIGPKVMAQVAGGAAFTYDGAGVGNSEEAPYVERDTHGKLVGRRNVVMVHDKFLFDLGLAEQAVALGQKDAVTEKSVHDALAKFSGSMDPKSFQSWAADAIKGKSGFGAFSGGTYKFAQDPNIMETVWVRAGWGSIPLGGMGPPAPVGGSGNAP
jgi:hypothetical protein